MAGWIIAALAVLSCVLYLVRKHLTRRQMREATFMDRMRTSALYVKLYPRLNQYKDCCIEKVVIRPEEVRIVFFVPSNQSRRFRFEELGLDPVDRPAALKALAQAIVLDMPVLADPAKYYFSTHSSPRDGGGSYHWYEYAVQIAYKDQVVRGMYDAGMPREGIER